MSAVEPITPDSGDGASSDTSSAEALQHFERQARLAREAVTALQLHTPGRRTSGLFAAATAIREDAEKILEANAKDMEAAKEKGLSYALLDRLELTAERVEAMAAGVEAVAELDDPVGGVLADWTQPNGLRIQRVRVPLGVVGIIYESRPNVTADAGALCLRSGNAVILRGGSESWNSSNAITEAMRRGLIDTGLPENAVQLIQSKDRSVAGAMMTRPDLVDVLIPRGGKSLIERVLTEARVPTLAHLEGVNHIYIDGKADRSKARRIVLNSKMRRPAVCGAVETVLVDAAAMGDLLPPILDDLITEGCDIRGDAAVCGLDPRVERAEDSDWGREYLDAIISVKTVGGIEGAIKHIRQYGSNHTDAIVTEDEYTALKFMAEVDSAIVLHNASTQFADGGEFGMGAEIGIATGRLHARGPVGAEQLTSFRYFVFGDGQVRP